MCVSKVIAGEQKNCGLILNPTSSTVKLKARGSWLEVPLSDVTVQNGIITCVESYNSRNNIFEHYNNGEEYTIWLHGKTLFLLANRTGINGDLFDYDTDLVTFEEGEYYSSSKGMKLSRQDFRPADKTIIQRIGAFHGVNITVYEPALNPLNTRDVYCTIPPNFKLEIAKSGVKSGQFIL